MKSRGLNRTVVIRSKDIGQMLRWAEKRKPWRGLMADGNPADLIDVKKLLDHDYEEQRDRLLSPDEIRELRDILERLEKDYEELPAGQKYSGIRPVNTRVQCALWICLSTLCRIGELLKAEWRYLDLKKAHGSFRPRPQRAIKESARITTCSCQRFPLRSSNAFKKKPAIRLSASPARMVKATLIPRLSASSSETASVDSEPQQATGRPAS